MRDFDPALLKARFGQLVDAVGTQEAAATFLGISRQRVGQLISTANNDLPTWGQVWKLEQVTGTSLVFAALGREIEDAGAGKGAMNAAVESAAASGRSLQAVFSAKADGILEPHEIRDAQSATREALEAAQAAHDEAMRMKPTLRAVA